MKHQQKIVINKGTTVHTPYRYAYGGTKDIALHMCENKVVITFDQSVKHQPQKIINGSDAFCSDAIKKAMLIHLILYSKPLEIKKLGYVVNDEATQIYRKDSNGSPLVYSMIEQKLDHPLPDTWRSEAVIHTILNTAKSAYDGRMNALIALLLGKAELYRSQKSIYLWMAMNGFYNYLTEKCKELDPQSIDFKREYRQHEFLCSIMSEPYNVSALKDPVETKLFQDGLSKLKKSDESVQSVFEKPELITTELELCGQIGKKIYTISPRAFLSVWLPYRIRCTYFHTNTAMPLFSFADEPLLKALLFTNYFVEKIIQDQLPYWLSAKQLTQEQAERILASSPDFHR